MATLLVLALGASGVYLAVGAWWPFMACRRCTGTGKRRCPSGRAWRDCRRCGGSGKWARLGRRVYELGRYGARGDR